MSLLHISRPRGQHRAIDRVAVLEQQLAEAKARASVLQYRLTMATAERDDLIAKANRLREELARAVEATRQNTAAVSSLAAHPAVVETQPIPVLPLHLSPLAGPSPSHVPGRQ
ncbi:hypothetical protein ACIA6C_27830 [Streptomyces sp. NPDC051578]|uniref:hypothetical protein n=1 Tax=Streptomyces sp. NPDC051578 TaxID=3365662 RepID=UPI0037B63420